MIRFYTTKAKFKNSLLGRNIPLHEWAFISQARKMYRGLVRQIYKTHERHDLMEFVRDEFKAIARQPNLQQRKYLLSKAMTNINQMTASLGISLDKKK
ncbi:hypothetical protein Cantr_08740 [Candida viswanathii]|uniref:Uncharacterized protein n=1 Tax=Candida viswanathii TaxID=5486 RepID=A0A367Y5Q7_9ASCO|nr:hypothetical protein Cantr_08740 [Candida viswanathii]